VCSADLVPSRREHVPLTTGLLEAQHPRLFHRRQQLEEAREPVLALVEVGALADDGLLERRRIHRPGGLREEALGDVLGDTRDRVLALLALLLAGALRRLGGAGLAAFVLAVLVLAVGLRRPRLLLAGPDVDELVAGVHEVGRGRLLHRHADDDLVVLPQLVGQGHEVRVARGDDEGVDVLARVTEFERVDGQPHVRGVLSRPGRRRDAHQLHPDAVQVLLRVTEPGPVAVRAPEDHLAAFQLPVDGLLEIELTGLDAGLGDEVLEIDEQRDAPLSAAFHGVDPSRGLPGAEVRRPPSWWAPSTGHDATEARTQGPWATPVSGCAESPSAAKQAHLHRRWAASAVAAEPARAEERQQREPAQRLQPARARASDPVERIAELAGRDGTGAAVRIGATI